MNIQQFEQGALIKCKSKQLWWPRGHKYFENYDPRIFAVIFYIWWKLKHKHFSIFEQIQILGGLKVFCMETPP